MSDAVVGDGEYADDIITLGGKEFAVTNVVSQSISEFSTGLKIGRATYDEREHAFFTVFDDFSGGFGYRNLDVREAGGTHWDNNGGVDLRRARHITLPPPRSTVTPANQPTNMPTLWFNQHTMVVSDVGGTEFLQAGIGDSMYTLNSARDTLTRRTTFNPAGRVLNRINRVLQFTQSDGTRALFAFGYGATLATQRYWRSTNGTTWSESGTGGMTAHAITEAIVWDGKIIGMKEDGGRGIISSADGATWSSEVTNDGVHWIPGGYIQFVGVAMAPWGAPAPYFLDEGKLWCLDYYVYSAMEIQDLGEQLYLHDGIVYNGSLFVTSGNMIWSYNPASGETVRFLGPFGKDGTPPTWNENNYHVVQFLGGTSNLFALCRGGSNMCKTRLLVFTGTGWTWYGDEFGTASTDEQSPYSSIIDRFPVNWSLTIPSRAIDVICGAQGGSNVRLQTFQLPVLSEIPYIGSNPTFADGPKHFEIGWYDGGFSDLEGALLRMELDGYHINTTETVKVEYRLDNDETGAYTELGTFTANQQAIWFDDNHRGVVFKTVQFRITLDRTNADNTKSPELKSLVLIFDKKPNLRTAWSFTIDIRRCIERGLFESIADLETALEGIWNTKNLVPLVVPSVKPLGINVRQSEKVARYQEVRDDGVVGGTVQVTVLEPVV